MNPLTTEQRYQTLQQSLPLMASRRTKLLRLVEFFEPLIASSDRTPAQAYTPELLGLFLREASQADLAATPTPFIRRLSTVLEALRDAVPNAADEREWSEALSAITRQHQAIESVLRSKRDEETMMPVRARGVARSAGAPPVAAEVIVPVVESELLLQGSESAFARLSTVRVEAHFSRKAQGEDEIFVDQVFDPDGTQHRQVRKAVQLARILLRQFTGAKDPGRLIIHCVFDEPNIIAGESMGAALAFAVFAELVHLLRHREIVAVRPNVAITGVTDANGMVLPVDETGLRLKVQACAYSRTRFLVVPHQQVPIALDALAQLSREDPSLPGLTVIGVTALHEILYDRRLTVVQRIPLTIHVAERVWEFRRPILVGALILALAFAVRVWEHPVDPVPDRIEFENADLVVLNRAGEPLDRIRVGPTMAVMNRRLLETQRTSQLAVIADVDGDGVKEVIAVRESDDGVGTTNELCCWKLTSPRPVWVYRVQHHVDVPNISEPLDDRFSIQGIAVDEAGGSTPSIVVIACHPKRYPAVLTIVHGSAGTEVARYLHMGWLNDVLLTRLAGDTARSIVACGINNAFREAAVIVFDPAVVRGTSPTAGEWTPRDFSPGTERYYVLFPRTMVGETFRTQYFGNLGIQIGANKEGRLRFTIEDFKAYVPELGQNVTGILTCILGDGLRLESTSRNEALAVTAEYLQRKGKIQRPLDDAYFAEYRRSLRYWDGERWVNTPTVNRWYRSAVNLPGRR